MACHTPHAGAHCPGHSVRKCFRISDSASKGPLPHQARIWQLASLLWLQSLARITVPVSEHPASQGNIPSASLSLSGANPALRNRGSPKGWKTHIPGWNSKAALSVSEDSWSISCGFSVLAGWCGEGKRRKKCPRLRAWDAEPGCLSRKASTSCRK